MHQFHHQTIKKFDPKQHLLIISRPRNYQQSTPTSLCHKMVTKMVTMAKKIKKFKQKTQPQTPKKLTHPPKPIFSIKKSYYMKFKMNFCIGKLLSMYL